MPFICQLTCYDSSQLYTRQALQASDKTCGKNEKIKGIATDKKFMSFFYSIYPQLEADASRKSLYYPFNESKEYQMNFNMKLQRYDLCK